MSHIFMCHVIGLICLEFLFLFGSATATELQLISGATNDETPMSVGTMISEYLLRQSGDCKPRKIELPCVDDEAGFYPSKDVEMRKLVTQ